MRILPLLLPAAALAACQAQDGIGNNRAGSSEAPVPTGAPPAKGFEPGSTAPSSSSSAPVQTATLTGLYEAGTAPLTSQMCVIESGGSARFGLVHRAAGGQGCGGAGTAVRQGAVLRLSMTGDEPCVIEARIEGTRVSFPASLPAGCRYYCSAGARLDGLRLDKTGGTEADARRAEDLIGDRLCASAP